MVDWSAAVLGILRAAKKDWRKVDPKYIVVKPRLLSDDNIWRGVGALRAVLAFIPPAALAIPVLSLGEMGFNLWKRISLARDYDHIKFPPIDPNTMRVSMQIDAEMKKHYGRLLLEHNWNDETISELEKVYNDFSFITNPDLLRAKYPEFEFEYIKMRCQRNKDILQTSLDQIEQEIMKVSHTPEIRANLQEALEALKDLFPTMRDWALFNSEGFQEIVEIIDTIV